MSDVKPYKESSANKRRATAAETLMIAYAGDVGGVENDMSFNIGDFLADLIHYCIQAGISFEDCLDQAEMHVASERTGRE